MCSIESTTIRENSHVARYTRFSQNQYFGLVHHALRSLLLIQPKTRCSFCRKMFVPSHFLRGKANSENFGTPDSLSGRGLKPDCPNSILTDGNLPKFSVIHVSVNSLRLTTVFQVRSDRSDSAIACRNAIQILRFS